MKMYSNTYINSRSSPWLRFHFSSVVPVRNHEPPQWYDIIHFEHKLSCFVFGFPKNSHTNEDVFLTYKPMIIPLVSQCGTPSQQFLAVPNIFYEKLFCGTSLILRTLLILGLLRISLASSLWLRMLHFRWGEGFFGRGLLPGVEG